MYFIELLIESTIKQQSYLNYNQAMLFLYFSKSFLSSSKNYINTFKVRSRLAQFFKHIHPDQMSNAPTKIKDQNLRSLKNFNSYLDAINQEKPIQGKMLKFYISEKSNNKSRKFFSFNLQLPQLNSQQVQLTQDKAGKLIDDIVNAMNSKYRESRNILQGKKPQKDKITLQPEVKLQTQQQKIDRLQQTTEPYNKTNYRRYFEQQRLKNAINSKFMQSEKQILKLKLRKNMSFANTSTNKPMMWSRIIMEESGIYNDYQQILNHLIDPKLIYFSEQIDLPKIQQFKKKLLPGQLDRLGIRATQAVLQVCQEMESYNPPVCLYVTSHYSSTDIPGFFSIPYNFQPVQMLEKWKQCKSLIIGERQKYQNYYDYFQDLKKELQANNKIKINQLTFKNNIDISYKLTAVQRLSKYNLLKLTSVNIYEADQFKIFCRQYQLDTAQTVHLYNNKIFMLISFQEQHLKSIVQLINHTKVAQSQSAQ